MNFDYNHILDYSNRQFDINEVINYCKYNPYAKVLIEVNNTKDLKLDDISKLPDKNIAIRVAGGYDKDRVARRKNVKFTNGETGQYYIDAVIYTKVELYRIIEEMEYLEKGIIPEWSDIQKAVFLYDKIKHSIVYDPKKENKLSSEIRSLRGLITKETVCAGYSMIFKELMDRNNISCEYVEGFTRSDGSSGHAWNILNIEGKKIPIDLTWDSTKYRSGVTNSYNWIGTDIEEFIKTHHPGKGEKTQDYKNTLFSLDPQFIRFLYKRNKSSVNYSTTTFVGKRKDGSKCLVSQIHDTSYNGINIYKYYYINQDKDGKQEQPLVLYSRTNLTEFINRMQHGMNIPDGISTALANTLFSENNIKDSISQNCNYIGKLVQDESKNYYIKKDINTIKNHKDLSLMTDIRVKNYNRKDGSSITIQECKDSGKEINGITVYHYQTFELVKNEKRNTLLKNDIYTERDILNDNRPEIVNDFLSRERLDSVISNVNGYVGYYDANNNVIFNPDLVSYYTQRRKFDIKTWEENKTKKKAVKKSASFPSFESIKKAALAFDIKIDFDNPSNIQVVERKTGKLVTNQADKNIGLFANIWLSAAGIKYYENEERNGFNYAFNEPAEKLYNYITSKFINDVKNKGVIDTAELFKIINENSNYKHAREILIGLFRTPYQTNLINSWAKQTVGVNNNLNPEALYSLSYAGELVYGNDLNNNGMKL